MALPAIDISMVGDRKLRRAFARLPVNFQRKIGREAIRGGTKPMFQAVKANAPRGPTGDLKRRLKLRTLKRSRVQIGVQITTGTMEDFGIPKKSAKGKDKFFYPFIQDVGSAKLSATRFMREKFDAMEKATFNRIVKLIDQGVQQDFKKGK